MTLRIEVTSTDIAALEAQVRAIPQTLFRESRSIFRDVGFKAQRAVVQSIANGPLYRRTGALARSIGTATTGNKIANLSMSVFSQNPGGERAVVYAPIHETGGLIKARDKYLRVPGGPYLNIPLDSNKTAAGVTRQSARTVFREGGNLLRTRRGGWLVVKNLIGAAGELRIVPMFALVKQVRIPARLRMRETVSDFVPQMLERLRSMTILDE